MKKLLLFLLLFINYNINVFASTNDYLNDSAIVQIISFSDTNGKDPYMLGWGSASIINDSGVLISNNHVVDSGNGALASAFLVCITKNHLEKPSCDYTASLINRDEKMDISILKIDSFDIYGNPVNYSQFKHIDVDFDYVPQNQDEVVAIGYPWVGADTITETKGIVSGVIEQNFYKYIKTDTLIAGGNSGGALINKDGKLIGIPTFIIGGWFDSSLSYALLISEAKDFIEGNINNPTKENEVTKVIDFKKYRETIENLNKSKKINDEIFDFSFSENYEIKNYYKNEYFEIGQKRSANNLLTNFNIKIKSEKIFRDEKEFFYYLETTGFYNREYQKLLKRNISGIDFYYPIYKEDLSKGDYWGNFYVGYYKNKLIYINIEAPFYDETIKKELKTELDNFLKNLTLKKEKLENINFEFSSNIPKLSIKNLKGTISNKDEYKIYFSNKIYENSTINLFELYGEYEGKGKSVEEIYNAYLKDMNDENKSMIKLKGLEGFYYCSDGNNYYYGYNPFSYYAGNYTIDENGSSLQITNCNIKIFFPLNESLNRQSYLNIDLYSKKENIAKNLTILLAFLDKYIELDSTGETNLINIYKEAIKLNFKDIGNQSDSYKKFLKLLVKYKVIDNSNSFDGEKAITWGEYAYMYSKYVYKIDLKEEQCEKNNYSCIFKNSIVEINNSKIKLDSIFKQLGIKDYNEYVDLSNSYNFGDYLLYKLAGINIGEFTQKNIDKFKNLQYEEKYLKENEKLEKLYHSIYQNRKIGLNEVSSEASIYAYRDNSLIYSSKNGKIIKVPSSLNEKVSLSFKDSIVYKVSLEKEKLEKCEEKTNFNDYIICAKYNNQKQKEIDEKYYFYDLNSGYYYNIMSKYDMFDLIFNQVDFAMFDEKLAKRKEILIEEESKN